MGQSRERREEEEEEEVEALGWEESVWNDDREPVSKVEER